MTTSSGLGLDAELAQVLGHRLGGREALLVMKASRMPGRPRRGQVLRRARDRVAADVDDAVEVEHRQVVGAGQRLARAPRACAAASRLLTCVTPTMLRWTPAAVVIPPYVARPLRLLPFRGSDAGPAPGRRPGLGARSSRDPTATSPRGSRSWQERGQLRRDDEPALYLHEYTAGGLTVRGLVGALDISHRATRPEDRAVFPHEGIHPRQAAELADRMTEMAAQPGADPARAPRPAEVRARSCTGCSPSRPIDEFVDRADQQHRVWAIRDPRALGRIDDGARRHARP